MTETSWPWGGRYIGDSRYGHEDADISAIIQKVTTNNPKYSSALFYTASPTTGLYVSSPAFHQVRVGLGYAIVDGVFYENTANLDLGVYGVGYHWIVLRKSIRTQTVRAAVLGATDSISPQLPGLNTITNNIWEVPLAYAYMGKTGAVTVTNRKDRLMLPVGVGLPDRQGRSTTDWNFDTLTEALIDHDVHGSLAQYGVASIALGSLDTSNTKTINFATPYRYAPAIFTSVLQSIVPHYTFAGGVISCGVNDDGATMNESFTLRIARPATGAAGVAMIAWHAIGEQ